MLSLRLLYTEDVLLRIMANCLFKGQGNAVNLQATGLLSNLGWNETTLVLWFLNAPNDQ